MKAIIIDDEPLAIYYMKKLCSQVKDLTIEETFDDIYKALAYIETHKPNIIFTDIEMPGMNGIEAAKNMLCSNPNAGIIFVTGYEQYALTAFEIDAISYIMKPCTFEQLDKAVKKAMKLISTAEYGKVFMRTFGSFDMMIDNKVFRFSNKKAQELLAILIDKQGGIVNMEQAITILWDNRPYDEMVKRLYRKSIAYLNQICKENNLDFFVSNRGCCHIIPCKIECDLFKLFQNDAISINVYNGEYMSQYSWAEETIPKIERFLQNKI